MAKQKGIIKFVGKVGDTVYYYHKHYGYLARKVTSVDAERIRTDPAFARVRENNNEFAQSAWAVKLLRAALRPLYQGLADTRMTSRLTRGMLGVIKSDTVHAPGQRTLECGSLESLPGIDFNLQAPMAGMGMPTYTTVIDRVRGICRLSVPSFQARRMRYKRGGATHFRLVLGVASVDFSTGKYMLHTVHGSDMPVRGGVISPVVLEGELPERAATVFVALGIEFLQAVNGQLYPLADRQYSALTLVYAEKAAAAKKEYGDCPSGFQNRRGRVAQPRLLLDRKPLGKHYIALKRCVAPRPDALCVMQIQTYPDRGGG